MKQKVTKLGGIMLLVALITSLLAVFAGSGLVAADGANPVRTLPAEVNPGDEFQVTVTFISTADNFTAIVLADVAPVGWSVSVDKTWCTPDADDAYNSTLEEAEYIWYGPYAAGVVFTAVYKVQVPADATPGTYNLTDGTLEYYIGGEGPYTEDITGDYQVEVVLAKIVGETREVNSAVLPGVTITLYQDDVEIRSTVSDGDGHYELAVPELGDYVVVASKEGFRNKTRAISVTEPTTYILDFVGDYGLIPNAPNMSYVLACINLWKFGTPPYNLNMSTVLAVINAWKFPVQETDEPITFDDGDDVTVISQVIPVTGGTIEVGSNGTPIDDIQVEFPAGALIGDTNVSLGYDTGTLTPNEGTYAGVGLILDTGNVTEFEQPVTITIPFTDIDTTPVPYYVDSEGNLHPMQLIEIDRTAKTFTFQTFHASIFTWILSIITYAPGPGDIVDTGYSPGEDGFQVVNDGSEYNRGGECFGMTSFSMWYYMSKKSTKGDFYPKYMNIVGTDSDGNSLHGQDIIATRSFISISQKWTSYYSNIVRNQMNLSDEDRYASIRNVILNTANPVLIYLWHETGTSTGAHSVLAYAFNHLDATVSIYDPNHPGQSRTISYNTSTKSFDPYSGYDGIVYNGDGSLRLTEPYQNILDDADADFQGSGDATISITSHTNGQEVTEHNIVLSGNIQSGQVLVTRLKVWVGSTRFQTNVGADGSFDLPISLENGINHLQFATEGADAHGNTIHVPNNMATIDFTLDLNLELSVILVTLTWDTNDTDVDLYVIDPTGDYSCYYHKITADGGELDIDVIWGYGPEHWTLMITDTVRYSGPYKVRLHYYSDHGNGPTNYTVSIKLYEGTDREMEYWYTGNLAAYNSSNNGPDDTGPDWVDIADILLEMEL